MKCSVANCDHVNEKRLWRGMCQMHYKRARYQPKARVKPAPRYCSVKGCSRRHCSKGLCKLHWERQRANGSTNLNEKFHLMSGTATYHAWRQMKRRCLNPSNKRFKDYGGRGITVCQRWLHSFQNFLTDMGERPGPGYSLERTDNNGSYAPENCCWATAKEQQNNTRRNVYIEFKGRRQKLTAWSEETGLRPSTISTRLERGWSIEEALTRAASKTRRLSHRAH